MSGHVRLQEHKARPGPFLSYAPSVSTPPKVRYFRFISSSVDAVKAPEHYFSAAVEVYIYIISFAALN